MRYPKGFLNFLGINLNETYSNNPVSLREAHDVFVNDGRLKIRPGRVEIGEAQISVLPILGVVSYIQVDSFLPTQVVVREDGIFQKVEV